MVLVIFVLLALGYLILGIRADKRLDARREAAHQELLDAIRGIGRG